MKRILVLLLAALLFLAANLLTAGNDFADAERLWRYIAFQSPYSTWMKTAGNCSGQPTDGEHELFHRVFINETGYLSFDYPLRYGTVIVKENISTANKVTSLTVMSKSEGFDPDNGDWFWAKYSPEGRVERAGKIMGCIGCHRAAVKNDYLLVHRPEMLQHSGSQ